MPVRIYTTNAGADLSDAEAALLADLVARHGRAVLLAPTFAELDLCRHDAAEVGVSLGIDYKTPSSWLRSLWELLGDGRGFVDNLQRQMLFSDMVTRLDDADLQPLSRSQGTVRMLARMARDVLPGVAGTTAERCRGNNCQPEPKSDAEARVFELLRAYADGLDRRDMVEPCEAADIMAGVLADSLPACTRAVCVRGITSFAYALLELLSAVANNGGEVVVLLAREQAAMREELAVAFDARGVLFEVAPLGEDAVASDAACGTAAQPAFIEVAGPHARAHVYADAIDKLVKAYKESKADKATATPADPVRVLVVSARAETVEFTAFSQSIAGRQFAALAGLIERMKAADEGAASKTEWWPAPELTDWIYSPLSGADAVNARTFDKNMRLSRSKTTAGVKSLLQSVQGQVRGARKAASDENWFKNVPCVVSDVFQALWRDRPVTALKAMLAVAEALPDRSLGSLDGQARRQAEVALLRHVIDILMNGARALDVSQAATVPVLDGVRTRVDKRGTAYDYETYEVDRAPRAQVRFASLADAAALRPGSYDAVLFADVDLGSYPLSHEEGPLATLAASLGREGVTLEPAALLRMRFGHAMQAARGPVALARVTHDRQARECYPAAVWTELRAHTEAAEAAKAAADAKAADADEATGDAKAAGADKAKCVGEGDIVRDFDPAAGEGLKCERVTCEAPQHLSAEAVPYLVLRRRDGEGEDAPLVPRLTSASQIEAYSTCPLNLSPSMRALATWRKATLSMTCWSTCMRVFRRRAWSA